MGDYTEGPWRFDRRIGMAAVYPGKPRNCIIHAHEWAIYTVSADRIYDEDDENRLDRYEFDKEELANAQLIAAAPELLEACKSACDYYEMLERATSVEHPVLSELRQAIAKAKGEER